MNDTFPTDSKTPPSTVEEVAPPAEPMPFIAVAAHSLETVERNCPSSTRLRNCCSRATPKTDLDRCRATSRELKDRDRSYGARRWDEATMRLFATSIRAFSARGDLVARVKNRWPRRLARGQR